MGWIDLVKSYKPQAPLGTGVKLLTEEENTPKPEQLYSELTLAQLFKLLGDKGLYMHEVQANATVKEYVELNVSFHVVKEETYMELADVLNLTYEGK